MNGLFKLCLSIVAIVFIASVALVRQAEGGSPTNNCNLRIEKRVVPDSADQGQSFSFSFDSSSGEDFEFNLPAGDADVFQLNIGESAVVTEIVPDGWVLREIICEDSDGISALVGQENNILASCSSPGGATCIFVNLEIGNIPTLSEWGMIAAVAGLVLIGVFFAVKRKGRIA